MTFLLTLPSCEKLRAATFRLSTSQLISTADLLQSSSAPSTVWRSFGRSFAGTPPTVRRRSTAPSICDLLFVGQQRICEIRLAVQAGALPAVASPPAEGSAPLRWPAPLLRPTGSTSCSACFWWVFIFCLKNFRKKGNAYTWPRYARFMLIIYAI